MFIFSAILLLGGLLGCQKEVEIKKFRIGFAQCCADPWRDEMESEMRREQAFHPEVDLKILRAQNNSETQIEQIRQLLNEGIDLLIVSPNESEPLTPVVEEVYKSGIPIILIDRKTESEQYTAYIGADNYEIGETTAKYIASQFGGKANIIELQLGMTMTPAQDRSQGFHDARKKYPELTIAAQLELTRGPEALKPEFQEALRQHPDVNVVFAHNDFLAESAYNWAKEINRADSLFFVGIDGIPGLGKGIQAVEDGILDASLLYPTGGSEAIQLALAILNNLPFNKNNLLRTIVIEQNNARTLHLQMKKVESLQKNIDRQLTALEDLNTIFRNQRLFIYVLVALLLLTIVLGGVLLKSLRAKEEMNRSLEIKNREVLEQQQQIVGMSEELKLATQAKVDFFTNLSHEFRTPLTLILGYMESLLASTNIGKSAKQDLGMVRKNALRLLRLINQLMDFRKIESGKMAVRASENDLIAFTRDITEAFQKMADKRNLAFGFFAVEQSLPVWFDVTMMDKVLFNLLSNAFKFTPGGGKIQVAVVKDPISGKAIVKVEDNGRGMSRESVERAFEPFYQGKNNKTKGTGLGLSLSKELVSLHGGSIELWSEPGKGTRFEVALPLGKAHFREDQLLRDKPGEMAHDELIFLEEEERTMPAPVAVKDDSEQTLLLAEDNDDLRHFLKNHFGKTYRILEARDGNEGLDLALEEVPDLVIADIMMPGRDGLTLTKILKTDLRTSHIPIVLLTAQAAMEQKIEGIQTGADAYVTKPFNLTFLSEVVKNLLHGRQALRERYTAVLQPGNVPSGMGNLDEQFLRNFTEHVEVQHASSNLTVENLSEQFGMSRVQLFRKTKALLGESPNDYIQQVRLKKASQLLVENELTVAEIAYKVGYSSPGYFSTAFKGRYGCSPSEWRERKEEKG
ncbi:MAG: substrate-binding domain-containing protein [Saprospiraceae bacterium]